MEITHVNKSKLYVNMTNHCTNKCEFCNCGHSDPEKFSALRAEQEPTLEEIISDVTSYNLNSFSEIEFFGTGEPTCRLYDMLTVCKRIKECSQTPIRVSTNGHSSMIFGEDTAPNFKGLVDSIYISLNAPDGDSYMKLCHPKFGEDTFFGVMKFAREIIKYVPTVVLTVAENTLCSDDVERCAQIARGIGVGFEVRAL